MKNKKPKSPPKRSDYKEPTDKFEIELGSPAKGVTPLHNSTIQENGAKKKSLSKPDVPPPNPADPASDLSTSTEDDSSEIPLQSEENVSFNSSLFMEVQILAFFFKHISGNYRSRGQKGREEVSCNTN